MFCVDRQHLSKRLFSVVITLRTNLLIRDQQQALHMIWIDLKCLLDQHVGFFGITWSKALRQHAKVVRIFWSQLNYLLEILSRQTKVMFIKGHLANRTKDIGVTRVSFLKWIKKTC